MRFDPLLSEKFHTKKTFTLKPLTDEQLNDAFQTLRLEDPNRLSPQIRELLTVPLHLDLYARLILEDSVDALEPFSSLYQLYGKLWQERIEKKSHEKALDASDVAEAIYVLTERMQQDRTLIAPVSVLDRYVPEKTYLQSINFVRVDNRGNVQFFHQTLFDYCYARQFAAKGSSLNEEILNSHQHLFERSQMMQVLGYLRASMPQRYRLEMGKLLLSPKLRLHLRYLLIEWFGSLPEVDREIDYPIFLKLKDNPNNLAKFLESAQGNVAWFDLLQDSLIRGLMTKVDEDGRILFYLRSIITLRRDRVLKLLESYRGQSLEWDKRIIWCLAKLEAWNSDLALDMFRSIFAQNIPLSFEEIDCLGRIANSNPIRACRTLQLYLEKAILYLEEYFTQETSIADSDEDLFFHGFLPDSGLHKLYNEIIDEWHLKQIIFAVAQAQPLPFVEHVIDSFIGAAKKFATPTRRNDRYRSNNLLSFERQIYSDSDPESPSFLEILAETVGQIALSKPEKFRELVKKLSNVDIECVQHLLALGYLNNPKEYATDIFEYLHNDERRFDIGNGMSISRQLYSTAFTYGTVEQREQLEGIVLKWKPARWEIQYRDHPAPGYTQGRFLASVPPELLSTRGKQRLQELQRIFDDLNVEPIVFTTLTPVESPLKQYQLQKMSDKHLLRVMRKYDHTTGFRGSRRSIEGGIEELSTVVFELTKEDPLRFYRLAKRFDADIDLSYCVSILSGLAESDTTVDLLFELAEQFAPQVHGTHRIGYCRAIEKRAKNDVPDSLLSIMREWALSDPDPNKSRESAYESKSDWSTLSINSVRGVALKAVFQCELERSPIQIQRIKSFLTQVFVDQSPAVGACLFRLQFTLICEEYVHLLNDEERKEIIDTCARLLAKHPQLLDDHLTHGLDWLAFYHFPKFGRFVEVMLSSSIDQTRKRGAELACIAAFRNVEAQTLQQTAMNGDDWMRQGAAWLYSHYAKSSWRSICLENLTKLMHDSNAEVQKNVGLCFANLRGEEDLDNELRAFVREYCISPCFRSSSRYLIDFMKPVALYDPELALEVTEQVVKALREGQLKESWNPGIVSLPLAVYTRTEDFSIQDRAMKLFEDLLEVGFRDAKEALTLWDQHRIVKK